MNMYKLQLCNSLVDFKISNFIKAWNKVPVYEPMLNAINKLNCLVIFEKN